MQRTVYRHEVLLNAELERQAGQKMEIIRTQPPPRPGDRSSAGNAV